MMIGTFDERRSSLATSKPDPSGSITSRSTRSGRVSVAVASAEAAVPATDVSKPSRARASESGGDRFLVLDEEDPALPSDLHPLSYTHPRLLTRRWRSPVRPGGSRRRSGAEDVPRRPRGESQGPPRRRAALSAGDEAAPHSFLCVVADAAPERVADALLEPGSQRRRAAGDQDAGLPALPAAADPEVVGFVAAVADDELHEAGPRLRRERDPSVDLTHPDGLRGAGPDRRDCERRGRTAAANRIPTVFFIWAISFVCRLGGLVVVGAVARRRVVVVSSAVVVGAAVRARAVVVAVAIFALPRAAVRARAVVVVTVVGRGAAGAARVVRVLGLVARTADVLAGRGADGRRGLRPGRGRFVRRRARRGEATGRVVRDGTTRERAACGEQHEGRQPDDQLAHCSSFWHGHRVANDLPRAGQARSRGAESLG